VKNQENQEMKTNCYLKVIKQVQMKGPKNENSNPDNYCICDP
jgi:hypothetical protein